MGAPQSNRFWEQRAKHGRDKLFTTPELLWQAACEYFEWCSDNPWLKYEQPRATTKQVTNKDSKKHVSDGLTAIPNERPFTMNGLCLYLDVNIFYFNQFKANLKPLSSEIDKDFSLVIDRIFQTIYTQKFEGAAVGTFNANLISRELGLADKTVNEHTGKDGAALATIVIQPMQTVDAPILEKEEGETDSE